MPMRLKKIHLLVVCVLIFTYSCTTSKKIPAPISKINLDTVTVVAENNKKEYRESFKKENDLLHTKLEVKFDWEKKHLLGKATLTCSPHFYPQSQLTLDAKGFDIHQIAVLKDSSLVPLKYTYDSLKLTIYLDKEYYIGEKYLVLIDYTAKPDEVKQEGGLAITDAKGLYFINHDGKEKNKPRQIWTQGETESNSCWFPTIDKPNVKCTEEIYITVDTNFVTLSNGLLIYSSLNKDGTRTDYWKMDLPHSTYLFMMAIGEYSIVKDKWRDIEVNYYVEPEFKDDAKTIFGNTPEMIEFFSKKLGYDYAWPKYSQVVVRDYVSGAMENTSATIHGEFVQKYKREFIDGNEDEVISHELFHHWFGDLVTAESWSNLPLNESFANYAEYLWNDYKYGREEADYGNYNDLSGYLREAAKKKEPLIRFHYNDKDDMFDGHSYNKGGRVLHMLRNYTGDEAFFKSLQLYLKNNQFKAAEIHHLRLAFEEVTGEDMNWFFNQWFLTPGHPKLDITYNYNDSSKTTIVKIKQTQNIAKSIVYQLPIAVDIYVNGKNRREKIMMTDSVQTFSFHSDSKPDLINVDADKILLCEKSDNKTVDDFAFQYRHAPLLMDRMESVNYFLKKQKDKTAQNILEEAMDDKFWAIKNNVIKKLKLNDDSLFTERIKPLLVKLAKQDKKSSVRANALEKLTELIAKDFVNVFQSAIHDSSYMVIASALFALNKADSVEAVKTAKTMENENNDDIRIAIAEIYSTQSNPELFTFYNKAFEKTNGWGKYSLLESLGEYLTKIKDESILDKGLAIINDEAIHNSITWIRKAASGSMDKVKDTLQENAKGLKSKMDTSGKNTPGYSEMENELNKLNSRIESIDKMIQHIKDSQKKS